VKTRSSRSTRDSGWWVGTTDTSRP
jgi:hypothetical protein